MSWNEVLTEGRELLGRQLFEIAGTPINGATLLLFIGIVGVTFFVAGLLQRTVERLLQSKAGKDQGTAGVVSRLLRYAVLLLGLSIGIHTVGINLSALFAAGALFAVAIGFAMQQVVANFVSGVILLAERVIKPGDILEVEGQLVRVEDMGIRATVVRTLDDEDLVLPNTLLVQSTVKNYTLRDSLLRLRATVGVAYESDLRRVRQVLESCAEAVAWRSERRRPTVLLTAFGASSVDFEVSVWIEDPWHHRSRTSQLREAIWWAFQDASITIAFPQVDVHFDDEVVEGLRRRAIA